MCTHMTNMVISTPWRGVSCPVFSVLCPVLCPMSSLLSPVLFCVLFPVSCFLCPVPCPQSCALSCVLIPVSCVLFPVSCVLFPVSCVNNGGFASPVLGERVFQGQSYLQAARCSSSPPPTALSNPITLQEPLNYF